MGNLPSWRGKIVTEFGLGQICEVSEGPYRLVYHIKPNQIAVITFRPVRKAVARVSDSLTGLPLVGWPSAAAGLSLAVTFASGPR